MFQSFSPLFDVLLGSLAVPAVLSAGARRQGEGMDRGAKGQLC